MKKKGLLLFNEISHRGGIEVFSKSFLESIIRFTEDADLRILILNNRSRPEINIRDTHSGKLEFFCCGSGFKSIRKAKFTFLFFCNLIFRRPDFIISNHIWILKLYWLFRPIFKIDYGFIAYGVEAWGLGFIDKSIVRNSKVIGSFSGYTRARINEQMDSRANIMLLPPTVSGDEFFPKDKDKGLAQRYKLDGSRVILTVARLVSDERYKGYDKVIQALPEIIKEVPNVRYLIAGCGDDTKRIQAIIKELDLERYVTLCGFVPDERLVDYYNLCDVFIMPSKGEGFGIVFLEALACGRPVIAGNKDASRDPLLDGEIGILIDPGNKKEIADATIKILKKEVPERLIDSRYLRRRVLEVYGPDEFEKRVKLFLSNINLVDKQQELGYT